MKSIQFRTATQKDLPAMQTMFVETIRNVCQDDYSALEIAAWTKSVENKDRWAALLDEQYFLLAEIDQELVGYGSLKDGNYLDFLYVNKDYQKMGIAKSLLTRLLEKAKESNPKIISSDVSITAKPFFLKHGFRVKKENKNETEEGIILINYRMEMPFE